MTDLNQIWERAFEEYYQRKRLKGSEPKTELEELAEKFIEDMTSDGSKPCDDTSESFHTNFALPPYYDKKLFKEGQDFFHKHMCTMIFGQVLGLTTLLATPSAAILSMTKQSSTPSTAFRRYLATIIYVLKWFQSDTTPESEFWSTLKKVRNMHNAASKQSTKKLKFPITQRDMSGTLFGFMGFAVTRGEMIGIYYATRDELKGFIHFWRVIGYMLGIEDRFNICRDSVEETIAICNCMITSVLKPMMESPSEDFETLCNAFYEGIKVVDWWSDEDINIHYIHMLIENTKDVNLTKDCLQPLNDSKKSRMEKMMYFLTLFRFRLFRITVNFALNIMMKVVKIKMSIIPPKLENERQPSAREPSVARHVVE